MLELKRGDLAGMPPNGWLPKLVCKILKARTFHWCIIVGKDKGGYILSESLGKGTAITRFVYPMAYIYRIKKLRYEPDEYRLISYHSWHGEALYDMPANILTGIWFLLKHYLKIVIPVIRNHTYNCQEHVVYMATMLGAKIIPADEYPYCKNLEKSEALEYLGEFRQ